MVGLYFVFFFVGGAGVVAASVLQLLHYPPDRIAWGAGDFSPLGWAIVTARRTIDAEGADDE